MITSVLTPTISPKGLDGRPKLIFYKSFKVQKDNKHFRFVLKQK